MRPGPNPRKILFAAFACLLFTPPVGSCGRNPADPVVDADCQRLLADPESADAIEWFKKASPQAKHLGDLNRDEGLAMSHELERRGATRIVAVNIKPVSAAGVDILRCNGLVVGLPPDPKARFDLFQLYAKQVRTNGNEPRADDGQSYLLLPWTITGLD